MRRTTEELVVITKAYDLILWSCHHTGKFPRNHRFVLGERIGRNLYDLLMGVPEMEQVELVIHRNSGLFRGGVAQM